MKKLYLTVLIILTFVTGCVRNTSNQGQVAILNGNGDVILELYLDKKTKEDTVDYFTSFTGDKEITEIIFEKALKYNIQPSLAFALAWNESRFKPLAYNSSNSNGTIDRGLFQLNSSSFPNLTREEFYDPNINADYGMNHLNYCLTAGKNKIAGLAIYNAGKHRVTKKGAPKMTLDYISKILTYQEKLEQGIELNHIQRLVADNSL